MSARTIWLAADAAKLRVPVKTTTPGVFNIALGTTLRLRIGLFENDVLDAGIDYAQVVVEFKPLDADEDTVPYARIIATELYNPTIDEWKDMAVSSVDVTFTAEELNTFPKAEKYLLCIWGIAAGVRKTWFSQFVDFIEDGCGIISSTPPPEPEIDYYTAAEVDALFNSYYVKTEVDSLIAECVTEDALDTLLDDYYTKAEVDALIDGLTDTGTGGGLDPSNYYTKTEVDDILDDYVTETALATALGDYYTETQIDTLLDGYQVEDSDLTAIAALTTQSFGRGVLELANASALRTYASLGSVATLTAGAANGAATLDSGGKVPTSQLPDSVLGQLEYQGTWNASTNTPTLAVPPASTTKGDYYVVSTAGTFDSKTFAVGDWIISDGTQWDKVDNTDAVTSVAGRIGAVTLAQADITGLTTGDSPTFAGLSIGGRINLSGNNTFAASTIFTSNVLGLVLATKTGSTYDFVLYNPSGASSIMDVATGTTRASFPGGITAVIGASTPNTGAFTTITATSTISGSNLSGTNTGDQTTVSGNAGSATVLQTTRTIGGSNFNGSANVTSFPVPGPIGATTPNTGAFTTLSTTGMATLNGSLLVSMVNAQMMLYDTGGGADAKRSDFLSGSGILEGRLVNDANNAAIAWLSVTRSGYTPTAVTLYNLNNTPIGNITPSTGRFTEVLATNNGASFSSFPAPTTTRLGSSFDGQNIATILSYGSNTGVTQGVAGGTRASPTATATGVVLAIWGGVGYDTTNGWGNGSGTSTARIAFETLDNFTNTAQGSQIGFDVTPAGSTVASRARVALLTSTGLNATAIGATTPSTAVFTSLSVNGAAGSNLVSYLTSPSGYGTYLELGPSGSYVEFGAIPNGDFYLSHNGVVGGAMRSVRSGAVADTLVLSGGVTSTKSLVSTVADGARAARFAGATGKVRIMGYDGGRAYIDAVNSAESSNIPLSFGASEYALNTSALEVSITNAGLSIGTATPYSRLHVEKAKSDTISESTAVVRLGANDIYLFTGTLAGTPSYAAWIQTMNTGSTPFPLALNPLGSPVLIGTAAVGSSQLRIAGLPTSATGLSTGDVWNDSGTLKIA